MVFKNATLNKIKTKPPIYVFFKNTTLIKPTIYIIFKNTMLNKIKKTHR